MLRYVQRFPNLKLKLRLTKAYVGTLKFKTPEKIAKFVASYLSKVLITALAF